LKGSSSALDSVSLFVDASAVSLASSVAWLVEPEADLNGSLSDGGSTEIEGISSPPLNSTSFTSSACSAVDTSGAGSVL